MDNDKMDLILKTVRETSEKHTKSIEDLQKSLDVCTKKFDELMQTLKKHDSEISVLKKDVSKIKTSSKQQEENISLVKKGLAEAQIYSRKNNIEISGLRENPSEKLDEMLIRFCVNIGVQLEKNEIDNIHN